MWTGPGCCGRSSRPPLRADWGQDMEWPYPGIPASLVASFAGHKVAALPFFAPETVTTDHGSVYKNHHLIEVQRVIGANILPARVLRPTDKQAVERAVFRDPVAAAGDAAGLARDRCRRPRRADPEADAVLTLAQAEHLVATWIVKVWQNRELGEYAPAWIPGTRHSPNTLFAAAMSQGGFALQIPAPELYYELLPVHLVKIHGRRGVKIRGLWYDGPALDPYRSCSSPQGGAARGKWKIRREPRDRRHVFFCDPVTHDWHTLRWTGLPPEGEVPSFSDIRADDLLRAARAAGLQPRSDAELLPLLLDLIGGLIPVDAWPTQMSRQQRTAHARESAQADQAAADRPAPAAPAAAQARQDNGNAGADAAVVPMRWRDQARDAASAVDAERRRRRELRSAPGPSRPR